MIFSRKTIFDILREADDDNNAADTAEETPSSADAGQDEAPAPEESGEDANSGDDGGGDDDFNIDTSLDDEGGDDSGNDSSGGDDSSSDVDGGSGDSGEADQEVKANTDIFASLTPEEQQIKIKELKRLYGILYTSTDDILTRISRTSTDEDSLDVVTRVTAMLYSLRQYISDYITQVFPTKSYIENDIAFNRFISILNGISIVVDEIAKIRAEKLGLSDKK